MDSRTMTAESLSAFEQYLKTEERSDATIEKYLRDAWQFAAWLRGRTVTKEAAASWKEHLVEQSYDAGTVNGKLAALNAFYRFADWEDCRVKSLKRQRRVFRERERELTQDEYSQLLRTAETMGRERLKLLMETICGTGIRVSEVRYITVETAKAGKAEVTLKGKVRTILLPTKLCRKLLKYAKRKKIASGEIFLTKSGEIQKSKYIQSVVERNHYHVALAGQVGAIVTGQLLSATGCVTATVQPNHDGAFLAILDTRSPDVHAQAILTGEAIIPTVGKGHLVVVPTLTGSLRTGRSKGTAAANALPAVRSGRRHEAFGLGVRDTFIYI